MPRGEHMKIEIHHRCSDFNSYRAARCKSLFNVESGCNFDLEAEIPIEDNEWCLGLIVGPSGSGKTSIGKKIFGGDCFYNPEDWPDDKPIIDAISPKSKFDDITKSLAGVGLGSVPAWLRPFPVLSNGEKFRANLARVICEAPEHVVIDEFTSVVDRQVAQVGAYAFSKNWKRIQSEGVKKCVLLSCHYDIIDWLEPDWVYDIATGQYQGRGLWRRPKIELEIYETNWRFWNIFMPHHYLKVGPMPAARVYLGVVDGTPVAHYGVGTKPSSRFGVEARGARFVVMPEWQGVNIGMSFVNTIAQLQLDGKGVVKDKRLTMVSSTSHPGLCRARRKDPKWQQITSPLHGQNPKHAAKSMKNIGKGSFDKFGGHWRAVQGFRYVGENPAPDMIVDSKKFRRGQMYDKVQKNTASRNTAKTSRVAGSGVQNPRARKTKERSND